MMSLPLTLILTDLWAIMGCNTGMHVHRSIDQAVCKMGCATSRGTDSGSMVVWEPLVVLQPHVSFANNRRRMPERPLHCTQQHNRQQQNLLLLDWISTNQCRKAKCVVGWFHHQTTCHFFCGLLDLSRCCIIFLATAVGQFDRTQTLQRQI